MNASTETVRDPNPATSASLPLPRRRRRTLRIALFTAGPALLLLLGVWYFVATARYSSTDNAYVKADIAAISAEVSGRVESMTLVDNQSVAAGDALFKIDDRPFKLALAAAEARLSTTRDEILAQEASYRQKLAEIDLARKNVDFYTRELAIYEDMAKGRLVAQTQLDEAHHNLTVATEQLPALQQELAGILAQLGGSPDLPPEQHPRYLAAEAARDQAKLDLEHTVVRAPAPGIVSNLTLRPGDYVTTGTPIFSLVETNRAWVEANFKETDLTYVRPGQTATLTVDTYPGTVWQARVESIGAATGAEFALLPPQNSSGNWVKVVQRIPVRLAIEGNESDPPLRAGMSVVVEIDTEHRLALPSFISSAFAWVGAE
jgi:membrane fusion protein (multidrug efflux system)